MTSGDPTGKPGPDDPPDGLILPDEHQFWRDVRELLHQSKELLERSRELNDPFPDRGAHGPQGPVPEGGEPRAGG